MSLPQNRVPDKADSPTFGRERQSSSPRPYAAVLTGPGRSAVAVVCVQGAGAQAAIATCFTPASERPWCAGDIRFGLWCADQELQSGESVVVTPLDGDVFEIHCHGGPAATARIMQDLTRHGVETVAAEQCAAQPSEPLIIREAARVLAACRTARTAAVALDQVRGALRDWAAHQQAMLQQNHGGVSILHRKIDGLLPSADLGVRLAQPFRVVLFGPPNVGKSSLLNAIVGYDRSITFDQAGTTRDVLHIDTVIDGIPLRFSDTAGIHSAASPIEREGISRARDAIRAADLVVRVTQPGLADDDVRPTGRSINVLNKADLAGPDLAGPDLAGPDLAGPDLTGPDLNSNASESTAHRTVAITGQGVPELMRAIVAELSRSFPTPGQPVLLTERQVEILVEMKQTDDVQPLRQLLDRLINGG